MKSYLKEKPKLFHCIWILVYLLSFAGSRLAVCPTQRNLGRQRQGEAQTVSFLWRPNSQQHSSCKRTIWNSCSDVLPGHSCDPVVIWLNGILQHPGGGSLSPSFNPYRTSVLQCPVIWRSENKIWCGVEVGKERHLKSGQPFFFS